VYYSPVNLGRLLAFEENSEITPAALAEAGIIKSPDDPVVILGNGELDRALVVKAHRFSAAAREKITKAGGSVEELAL
jgi:large subunit ribosomal protein L15